MHVNNHRFHIAEMLVVGANWNAQRFRLAGYNDGRTSSSGARVVGLALGGCRAGLLQRTECSSATAERGVARPSEGDIEFVLSRCDADANGVIDLAELGPAVAKWWEHAKDMKEEPASPKGSSACSIL